jgi:hypothetical protein
MANVWFVQRIGAEWKKVGSQPAFQRPLSELIFKLDLGPQRRLAEGSVPQPGDESVDGITPLTKVFVEVTPEDLADSYFGGYFPAWYDSPYSAPEVSRRLTQAKAVEGAAAH